MVLRGCFQNPPRDFEFCLVFFQIPNVFTEHGVVSFVCIRKRGFAMRFEYLVLKNFPLSQRRFGEGYGPLSIRFRREDAPLG